MAKHLRSQGAVVTLKLNSDFVLQEVDLTISLKLQITIPF